MKTLVLIRHAKSSWDENVSDLKRPLSERGISDVPLVGHEFKTFDVQPDAVYTSPAKRALTTCNLFMDHLHLSKDLIQVEESLYDFGGGRVRRFISSMDDAINSVIIFGHNHAFTTLVNTLGDDYIDNLPTCSVAMIEFDVDTWQDIEQGKTKAIIKPKDLK